MVPDCRARAGRGAMRGPGGLFYVPIYCANCHAEGGLVPEENTTFAFWLCNPCFRTMGEITNTMAMPDEVFWERVKQEQLERYRRLLTPQELLTVVEADASPLATLVKAGTPETRR